jgi:hypothetical protein
METHQQGAQCRGRRGKRCRIPVKRAAEYAHAGLQLRALGGPEAEVLTSQADHIRQRGNVHAEQWIGGCGRAVWL